MSSKEQADGEIVAAFKKLMNQQKMAVPVAAMNSLLLKMRLSKATTWMQLEHELSQTILVLKSCNEEDLGGRTNISLGSGCDLFMKHVTKAFILEFSDFAECKEELLRRGEKYTNISLKSRAQIAEIGHSFIQNNFTVLVHGHSRVVIALILKAAEKQSFNIILTEGKPSNTHLETAKIFGDAGIPTKVILDTSIGKPCVFTSK